MFSSVSLCQMWFISTLGACPCGVGIGMGKAGVGLGS